MYKTTIKDFGEMAPVFKEDDLFVLFGTTAPNELKDISYIHETEEISDDFNLNNASTLKINDIEFKIDKVGSEAHNNLMTLGHISVYLNKEDILPGAVAISGNDLPDLDKGDVLTFE